MPDENSPQIDDLRRRARRRLVGAIVLALAAAVLVPIMLESDPKPLGEDVAVKIPPIDEGKFVNKVGEKARVTDPPAKAATTAPKSATPPPAAAKESWRESAKDAPAPPKPANEAPKAAPPEAPAPAPTPKPAVAEPQKSAGDPAVASKPVPQPPGSFNVQLAAYSDDKGANALANRLKTAGHAAYVEPYTSSKGMLWRVRVGPFPTMVAAQAAQAKLKAEGHDGIIPPVN